MYIILYILYLSASIAAQSNEKPSKSKNPLPYFRRQVEEITEDGLKETVSEDSHTNIVSFLVKNLKEIFNDIDEKVEKNHASSTQITSTTNTALSVSTASTIHIETPEFLDPTESEFETGKDNQLDSGYDKETIGEEKIHSAKINIASRTITEEFLPKEVLDTDENAESISNLRKDMENKLAAPFDYINKTITDKINDGKPVIISEQSEVVQETLSPRTCIHCNNVLIENCVDPKNTLIPTVTCERDSDLCFSQHTPFGIIERGCYNVNYNLTTYVCSCNLCNYLSISEMPYIFSKKQDWIDNVIELSRTRNLRKSVFKDMSCLQCEVNSTTKTKNTVESLNCLEGNIGALDIQTCSDNEVCGVKAVRSDGYIWRGCMKSPRYNYWWSLCDGDECNLDPLISVFEFLDRT